MKKRIIAMLLGISVCAGLTGCKDNTKMPNYSQYLTLGEYKGIEYTPMSTEVTDAELQERVDAFLLQCATTNELTEGTVKDGDTINLDYIGYVDGEAFEGGNTNGMGTDLMIGSHSYIDDFEEQLIGHEVGEEGIEVNVTFPDDYSNADGTLSDLAGKDATFVCAINSIYEMEYPEELTDEIVGTYSNYDTVNSFMDALKMEYETYKAQQADDQMKADIITAAIENSTVNGYPEEEVAYLKEQTIQAAKDTATSYGMDYETYLSFLQDAEGNPYTVESYEADADEYIRALTTEKMVVCMIAKQEGITATRKDVQAYVEAECAMNANMTEDYIYENYTINDLAYAVIYDEVIAFLVENAIAIEE